ncbi:MAG: glycoside hydrolase family 97 catalytic domain-containing protein [Lacibacter sp.]
MKALAVLKLVVLLLLVQFVQAKEYELKSPSGNNVVKISFDGKIAVKLFNRQAEVLNIGDISMQVSGMGWLNENSTVIKTVSTSGNNNITVDVPVKFKTIKDKYNQLELVFKNKYSVIFRLYDNGFAYRFVTRFSTSDVIVENEKLQFNVADGKNSWWPYEFSDKRTPFQSHYEYCFKNIAYNSISDTIVGLPVPFTAQNGARIVFTESDLFDYPNLFVQKQGTVNAVFPHPITEQGLGGDRNAIIKKEAEYIASTTGQRYYPWRLWMINDDDAGLFTNTLVYQLATPSKLTDASWIKPGKVAWDWWNDNNIYGVNFKSGINNDTYKYYIDFAAKYGLDYILLDEGWTKTTLDLLHSTPDINVPELVAYGKEKNVGVILWVLWNPLNEKMDEILDLYQSWGVKGVKVDFMARGEQYMVNFYTRTAEACAKRKLLVDFHGAYKPTGLHRTYPNVISFEGVHGLENSKWEATITPEHNTVLPFTRMMAGPMDFTPGAMRNASKENFRAVFSQPMSEGTRAHQAALYTIFESPLQMLSDNPSNYLREPEYTKFLSAFPTTWDDTKVLYAEAGKIVVVARKHNNSWYIGGITNWTAVSKSIKLDFLGEGTYNMQLLQDGVNASKMAEDHTFTELRVTAKDVFDVVMSSGGGFAAILTPDK